MMPLWLDLLRTPMAAPETRRLRWLRRIWQLNCLALGATLASFSWLERLAGPAALPLAGALIVSSASYTILYWSRKHRADRSHLDQVLKGSAP